MATTLCTYRHRWWPGTTPPGGGCRWGAAASATWACASWPSWPAGATWTASTSSMASASQTEPYVAARLHYTWVVRRVSSPSACCWFWSYFFPVPTSGPQLVYQRPWYVLFCLWKSQRLLDIHSTSGLGIYTNFEVLRLSWIGHLWSFLSEGRYPSPHP